MGLLDFLFGKGEEVTAPYQTQTAATLNPYLQNFATNSISAIDPNQLASTNQNAYNQYQQTQNSLLSGILPSSYEQQLASMRDSAIQQAANTIGSGATNQVSGLLTDLAGKGVINSSVSSDGISQIGGSANSALASAITEANNTYSNSYLSGINTLSDMANNQLSNALNYTTTAQNQAFNPAQSLYGLEIGQEPTVKEAEQGLIPNLVYDGLSTLFNGLGSGAAAALLASDERLKTDIEYTGEFIDDVPVVTYKYVKQLDTSGQKRKGFLAQDVLKVHPERVATMDNGYLGIIPSMFSEFPA